MIKKIVISRAPGKLILFGEHAVVSPYSKLGIGTSLNDFGIKTSIITRKNKESETEKIFLNSYSNSYINECVYDKNVINDLMEMIDIDDDRKMKRVVEEMKMKMEISDDFNVCCMYIMAFMSKYYGLDINNDGLSYEIKIISDIPVGAGLGSSASLSVSIVSSIMYHFGILNNEKELSVNELNIINKWAYMLETFFHRNPSGLDNTICCFGGFVTIKGSNKLERIVLKHPLPKINLLIVNTNVERNTSDIVLRVKEQYLSNVDEVSNIFNKIENCTVEFLELCDNIHKNSSIEFENQFKQLVSTNQILLNQIDIGHERIDFLFDLLNKYSLVGKITGAGGGGCCYVIFSEYEKENIKKLSNELNENGYDFFITNNIGGTGITLDTYKEYD